MLGALVDHDNAVGIVERERAQEDGVKDTENGGVAPDAECEREDRDGSEDLGAAELTKGELQVSKKAQGHLACCPALAVRGGRFAHLWASFSQ